MSNTATISENKISVKFDGEALIVEVPNGWDDVKNLRTKVLEYEGSSYVFTGWNSDSLVAYFKKSNSFAKFQ